MQLPEVILAVDAQVRFNWIMLGREPRSTQERLMVYAGVMAHGTSLTAAECARMIPQLSATSIRQAMRWAGDERRLSQACQAVWEFMQRPPYRRHLGRSDLASSDMMSMETTKHAWQARLDPRRNTSSIGIYSHVRDRWGVFHAQPFVLNERQAGVAIENQINGLLGHPYASARFPTVTYCNENKWTPRRHALPEADCQRLAQVCVRAFFGAGVELEVAFAWGAREAACALMRSLHSGLFFMLNLAPAR